MLYIDIPTGPEFKKLNKIRANVCVSIYLKTTPISHDAAHDRVELGNLAKQARDQLVAAKIDKRQLAALMEYLDGVIEDDEFWRLQANSLAVLATPQSIRTYRLANAVVPMVQVSDRFHLKPLLRAITFPQSAFVLALSENAVRLIEVFSDMPPAVISVPGLPKDAASSVGKSTLNKRAPTGRIQGSEGQNVRYQQYARRVDTALRAVMAGRDTPLILATTNRLASIYQSVSSYTNVLSEYIAESPDRLSELELASVARPILDSYNQQELEKMLSLFDERADQGRATSDLTDVARAATYGAIEALLVDIDSVVPGTIDETTGIVTFAETEGPSTYGICDEIVGRALDSGAKVLGVRKSDLPGDRELAAILRYAV
jgi:hypothetical protein